MNLQELEFGLSPRKFEKKDKTTVFFTPFETGRNGGAITTTFPGGVELSTSYDIVIEEDKILMKWMDSEYTFYITEMDNLKIKSFDLFQGDELFHSLTAVL